MTKEKRADALKSLDTAAALAASNVVLPSLVKVAIAHAAALARDTDQRLTMIERLLNMEKS